MDDKATFQKLLTYLRLQWRALAAALVFFLLSSAVEPVIPALFKVLIDSGFQEGMKYPLWLVPVVVIGLFMIRGFFNFAGTFVMSHASSMMVLHLRTDLMKALLKADASLFTTLSPGRAVAKVINDPQQASKALSGAAINIVRNATTLLFLLGYLLYLNPSLTALAFITMPLLGFSVKLIRKRLLKVGEAQYEAQMKLVATVDDNARAWRVVRTFDAADIELARFERDAQHHRRMTMKQVSTSALITPVTQVFAAIGVSIILTLAIWQASQGQATVGEFVSFITALLMTISPMRQLTDVFTPLSGAMVAMKGAFELTSAPSEPDNGTRLLDHSQGKVSFKDVTLQYEGAAAPALKGLTLDIRQGQTIALVGSSGAGKSTVVSALLRFAHPQSGLITLDDTPINDLKLASLRRNFAVVSQDIILFEGSIAQNVAYASTHGVDRDRVEAALRAANLWNHVSTLPEGMDSDIGTNGSKLSGGQRQRLAIARALYRDAPIWIFDEATSALDSESESVVQKSIEDLRGSKTLIIIAHRLSTIRNADVIHVMSEGRVVESGSHDQLMAQGGLYAGMVRIQSTH